VRPLTAQAIVLSEHHTWTTGCGLGRGRPWWATSGGRSRCSTGRPWPSPGGRTARVLHPRRTPGTAGGSVGTRAGGNVADTPQRHQGRAAGRSRPHVGRRCAPAARRRGGRSGWLASLAVALGPAHPAALRGRPRQGPGAGGRAAAAEPNAAWSWRGQGAGRPRVRDRNGLPTPHLGEVDTGEPVRDKRPQGGGRVPVQQSGLQPVRGKAEGVERRPLRLEGGKDCKVLPILTYE
jgi:hypothetical protein